MIINNNSIAGKNYVAYTQNLNKLSQSASRLSTGEKFNRASYGSGELGIAHRMRMNRVGTQNLLTGFQNADGLSKTQDEILGAVEDIITRMQELATMAVDPLKQDSDRDALEVEFRALADEVADIASLAKYNDGRVFQTNRTLRIGMNTADVVSLSQIQLSLLTFVGRSVSTLTAASAAIISLKSRAGSLAVLRGKARGYSARIERMMAFTRDYIANLDQNESAITDIDVAVESGKYTEQQVKLNASQAVLASANNLPQQAQRFLNFQ